MSEHPPRKPYDLEERSELFAREVRKFVKRLPRTIGNVEDGRQLIKASGSVGANYIEANEALSRKDFLMRLKISRKEVKEAAYWLRLVDTGEDTALADECLALVQEATELLKIFSAIIQKSQGGG